MKRCEICRHEFQANRSDQKFCGECRNKKNSPKFWRSLYIDKKKKTT